PDTYFISPKEDETAILRRMVAEFDAKLAALDIDAGAAAGNITPYEAITVASLVQTETKVPTDGPKIARVIYNRLNAHMPLQIDATVIYATGIHRANGQVLNSDLKSDSPYNTYKVQGLPPTPIASAGESSLAAALKPDQGPWLYYVKFEADG